MNLSFPDLIPQDFEDKSHVWIYQSNKSFTIRDVIQIKKILRNYTTEWKDHDTAFNCYTNLLFAQFIIFISDQIVRGVHGCNSDSSIKLMKKIEKEFHIELFDRLMLAFIIKERIELLPLSLINNFFEKGLITDDTLYFNNAILTKKDLFNNWIIPVKESWLTLRINKNQHLKAEVN